MIFIFRIGSIIQTRQTTIWYHPDMLFRLSSLYKKHQECIRVLHNFSYKVSSILDVRIVSAKFLW